MTDLDRGLEESRRLAIEFSDSLREEVRRREQLPVDVDLRLLPRAVANANWPAFGVAAQVRELVLEEEPLASHPVHDLERGRWSDRPAGRGREEPEEPGGFVRTG